MFKDALKYVALKRNTCFITRQYNTTLKYKYEVHNDKVQQILMFDTHNYYQI